MRHFTLGLVALSASTFGCGGIPHDSPNAVTFDAPSVLTCSDGSSSQVVATGDFDGDHNVDVVGCFSKYAVSIFLNAGNGTYSDPINVKLANDGTAIEVDDVNGDGKSDIVSRRENSTYGVAQISFSNGDGTFAAAVDQPAFPLGCDNYHYSFNGKANSICYEGGHAVVTNMVSDGSTDPAFSVPVPAFPNIADVNADGKQDFVFAVGSTIAVQLGYGDGSFGATQIVVITSEHVSGVHFADVDDDGFIDIIARLSLDGSNDSGDSYAIFHNDAGNGFSAMNQFDAVPDVGYTFGDVTGDGIADVALSQGGQIVVMVGKGDGSFDSTGLLVTGPWTSANGFRFTDLNGDGKPDLLVGGSTVSVLLRQ